MNKDELWESYIYPERSDNREVLINKFDIRDAKELYKKEAEITFEKLVELYESPIKGDFNKEHLCMIHKYLFEDIYDWAGKFRIVDIEKGHSYFAKYQYIPMYLDKELDRINNLLEQVFSSYNLACIITELYIVLLNIHPFREGNGRAVREFVREFVLEKTKNLNIGQYELDWSLMDKNTIDEYIPMATSYRSIIELQFYKALKRVKEEYVI